MEPSKVSKALAAALVIAAPFLLATSDTSLAKKPGNRPACSVGSAMYPTIQSAVNDPMCSTIGVPAGIFRENVNILRSVTIRGEGPDRTIVDGSGASLPVFQAGSSTPYVLCDPPPFTVALEGMTITGGSSLLDPRHRNGGGIATLWSNLTVDNVVVTGNLADMHGGGISIANATLTVKNSVITNNTARGNCVAPYCSSAGSGGGGIRTAGCPNSVSVYDSVISDNVSHTLGGGMSVYSAPTTPAGVNLPPATLTVKDSSITGNTAWLPNSGGGIYFNYTNVTVLNTEMYGNAPNNVQQGPDMLP
jgi:hypothetical protein